MADDNLTVKFSADTSNLNSGLQAASKAVTDSTNQMRMSAEQARQMFNQFGTDLSKIKAPLDDLDAVSKKVASGQTELAASMKKVNETVKLAGPGIGFYARELHAVIDESLSGRFNQLNGTLANVLGTFAAANPALGGMVIVVTAVSAAVIAATLSFKRFNDALEKITLNSTFAGFAQQSEAFKKKSLTDLKEIEDSWTAWFTGLSSKESGEIFSKFESSAKGSTDAMRLMLSTTELWGKTFKASGDEVKAFADSLIKVAEAAKTPESAMKAIEAVNNSWTISQRDAMEQTLATSDAIDRQNLVLVAQAEATLRAAEEKRKVALEEARAAADSEYFRQVGLSGIANEELHFHLLKAAIDQVNKSYDEQIKKQQDAINASKNRIKTGVELINAAEQELAAYKSISHELVVMQNKSVTVEAGIQDLNNALKKDPTNAANIAKLQHLTEKFNLLKNAVAYLQAVLNGGTDYSKITKDLDLMAEKGVVATRTLLNARLVAEDIYRKEAGHTEQEIAASNERTRSLSIKLDNEELGDFKYNLRQQEIEAAGNNNKLIALKQQLISKLKSLGYEDNSQEMRTAQQDLLQAKIAAQRSGAKESERIDSEETKAAIANIDAEMEAVKDAANTKQLSRREELIQLIALENQKLQITIESINNQVKSEREKNALIEKAEAESARNRAKIKAQLDKQMIAEDRQMASEITNSFMGTATSILKGQMTLKQGLLQIGEQILTAQIKQYATNFLQKTLFNARDKVATQALNTELVASNTAAEAAKTSATEVGEAARVAAVAAGGAEGKAATIPFKISEIMGDSAMAFAGVFANLSPLMGPAAAAPAAAAQVLVASKAAEIPSFAVGSWELPSDMVANVHKGEMIIPAAPAQTMRQTIQAIQSAKNQPRSFFPESLRAQGEANFQGVMNQIRSLPPMTNPAAMLANYDQAQSQNLQGVSARGEADRAMMPQTQQGGGDTHHHVTNVHVGFVDTNGAAAFLKTHGDKLAKTVADRQTMNPSLRGKW